MVGRRTRDRISAVAGIAAVATAIFVLGGADRWAQAIVGGFVAIALVPTLLSRRAPTRVSPLVLLLGVMALVTAVQLVPLPGAVVDWLQPVGNGLREDGAEIAGVSPWRALTLDAPATLRALCFFVVMLGIASLALRFSVSERGRYRILAGIVSLCGLTAGVVLVHVVFGATSLYGIYTPKEAHPSILGPLLNENHLGSLMAAGAVTSSGLAAYQRQSSRLRALWIGVAVLCGATAFATHSRGASLALLCGAMITAGMLVAQRLFGGTSPSRGSRLRTSLPLAVVGISTIVVIIYASSGGATEDLSRTTWSEVRAPNSKFAIWRSTITLIEETPWVGVGRGAFEMAITRTHPAAAVHSFSHAENEYLQAIADWGIPASILVAIAAIMTITLATRRWREGPLVAGALGAIVVVAMQSVVDFGVELMGVAIPLTVIAATATYSPVRELTGTALRRARIRTAALAALVLAASVLLLSPWTRLIVEDREHLAELKAPSLDDARAVIERHPIDYFAYAVASQTLVRDQNPQAVRFLNHALRLHPRYAALHHMAARMLVRAGQLDQATIEYALALTSGSAIRPMLAEISERFPPDQAAKAIPLEMSDIREIMKTLVELKRIDVANAWLLRALGAHPDDVTVCGWLYSLALHSDTIEAAAIAGSKCSVASATYADRIGIARLLLRHGRASETLQVLKDVEQWPTRIDLKASGWLILCDAYAAQKDWQQAKRCLRYLDASGYLSENQRGEVTKRLQAADAALREAP